MYYSLLGTLITVIVGIIVSYATQSPDDAYESKLIHPLFLRISRWLPGKSRYYTDLEPPTKIIPKEIHDNYAFEIQQELPPKAIRYNRKPSQMSLKAPLPNDLNEISIDVDKNNKNNLAKTKTSSCINGTSNGINGINHNENTTEKINELFIIPTETYRHIDENETFNRS